MTASDIEEETHLSDEVWGDIYELFEPYINLAAYPIVEAAAQDYIGSKYFGYPWMGSDEEWPEKDGVPLDFILQLDVATLPEEIAHLLGGKGLLQFFYGEDNRIEFTDDVSDRSFLRIVDSEAKEGGPVSPPAADNPYLIAGRKCHYSSSKECLAITGWENFQDVPHYLDFAEDEEGALYPGEIEKEMARIAKKHGIDESQVEEAIECVQGDKLGGYPHWTQGVEVPLCSLGEYMVYIYQIDAGDFFRGPSVPAHAPELFAGRGTGHIFVSRHNPQELKFVWACV